MDFNGVARVAGGLVIAGSNRETKGSLRDGFVMRAGDVSSDAAFIGGTLNDQLFAVAARDDRFFAVGITRSFRGTDQGNHALLVVGGLGGALEIRRQRIPGDQAIEPRAISTHGTDWAVAGRHLDGQRFYVAVVDDAGNVRRARSFRVTGPAGIHTPQAVLSLGDRLVIVGTLAVGTTTSAFIADVRESDLQALRAIQVSGTTGASLDDVTAHADQIVAVGGIDGEGYVVRLDRTSGALIDDAALPVFQVAAVASRGSQLVAVADGGDALLAGELDATGLVGARHPDLRRSGFFGRIPLFVDGADPMFIGRVGITQTLREQPFNSVFEGQCGDVRLGEPISVAASSSDALVSTPVLEQQDLTIATDDLVAANNTSTAAEQSACP